MQSTEAPDIPALRRTTAKVLTPKFSTELEERAAQPKAQLAALREFVSGTDISSWAADTIRRLLRNRNHLEEVAAQSYAHPNGFDSIVLENSLPSHRVRLHVWWPETPLVTEDVHNHAWSFASRVLSGALNFETYRKSDAGTPFFHYPYQYGDTGNYSSGEAWKGRGLGPGAPSGTGNTTTLTPVFNACFTETTYYTFDLNELHHVAPIKTSRPVSTLVLTGKLQRNGSDVYSEHPRHGEGYRLLKEPYPAGPLAERLRRYLACL